MRIACPFCGARDSGEFTYLGDASPERPVFEPEALDSTEARDAFYEYVYLRDNPAGILREYWYHGAGCRSWLIVERNTLTHEISAATAAPGADTATATATTGSGRK
ncbi:MAG: sarcosine oxidase subunit delta [Bauldia sp.]|nr:sarcosine oxidase subunit delta [Bauldia sp.]